MWQNSAGDYIWRFKINNRVGVLNGTSGMYSFPFTGGRRIFDIWSAPAVALHNCNFYTNAVMAHWPINLELSMLKPYQKTSAFVYFRLSKSKTWKLRYCLTQWMLCSMKTSGTRCYLVMLFSVLHWGRVLVVPFVVSSLFSVIKVLGVQFYHTLAEIVPVASWRQF